MNVGPAAGLAAAGLGLDYGALRFARATEAWLAAGTELRDRVAQLLAGQAKAVRLIGSASVPGLLAKPIVDLAVGVDPGSGGRSEAAGYPGPDFNAEAGSGADGCSLPAALHAALVGDGWFYRGDGRSEGGHVFVLESRPWHRLAHLHVVGHDGEQWRNYLRLAELLRSSSEARQRYEAVKLQLAVRQPVDRRAYTSGKTEVIRALIAEGSGWAAEPG